MTESKSSIYAKLVKVMGDIHLIVKDGENKFHKYEYASASAIFAEVRQALVKNNVALTYNLVEENTLWMTEAEVYRTNIKVLYTLTDADSGESISTTMQGVAHDTADKGLWKALTGTEKYFLSQQFLIATKDDPEADEEIDKRAAAKSIAPDPYNFKGVSKFFPADPLKWRPTAANLNFLADVCEGKGWTIEDAFKGMMPKISAIEGADIADNITDINDFNFYQWRVMVENMQKCDTRKEKVGA